MSAKGTAWAKIQYKFYNGRKTRNKYHDFPEKEKEVSSIRNSYKKININSKRNN